MASAGNSRPSSSSASPAARPRRRSEPHHVRQSIKTGGNDMSRREITKGLAISAAVLLGLAGAARAEDVQLTFWNGFTGPDRPAIEEITKKFSDANPGITVTMDIMPWDSLMQ